MEIVFIKATSRWFSVFVFLLIYILFYCLCMLKLFMQVHFILCIDQNTLDFTRIISNL